MLPTHALAGMALALPLLVVAPELAAVGFLAGFLGGVLPDLDLYAGHRRTLHYPVYYTVFSGIALPIAALWPSATTVAIAFLLLGAALHCVADVFGAGLELRPWEATADHAVYDHYHGRWIPARRVVRYDGSPEDLLLSASLAGPLLWAVDGWLQVVVSVTLGVAVVYVALRRRLAAAAPAVVRWLPAGVRPYLPERYHDDDP